MPVIPCTNTPIVQGIVTFDPAGFRTLYPEFTGLSDSQLNQAFALAQLYVNNTCGSRVCNANLRETLLDLVTAHLAFLNYGTIDAAGIVTPAPGVVGRVDKATEGTVNVSAEMVATANNQFYLQTKYGAMFWEATARFRTMIYVAPVQSCDTPWGVWGGDGGFGGGGCGC
jgi:Protein of unknown function (DUF4054)